MNIWCNFWGYSANLQRLFKIRMFALLLRCVSVLWRQKIPFRWWSVTTEDALPHNRLMPAQEVQCEYVNIVAVIEIQRLLPTTEALNCLNNKSSEFQYTSYVLAFVFHFIFLDLLFCRHFKSSIAYFVIYGFTAKCNCMKPMTAANSHKGDEMNDSTKTNFPSVWLYLFNFQMKKSISETAVMTVGKRPFFSFSFFNHGSALKSDLDFGLFGQLV